MHFRKSLVILSVIGCVFLYSSTLALQAGDFTYTVSNNTVTITGYTGAGGAVVIPTAINNMPVTTIGPVAFQNCATMTSVNIPTSVTEMYGDLLNCWVFSSPGVCSNLAVIREGSFYNCPLLTAAYFEGNAPAVIILRCNTCTNIAETAFYGSSNDFIVYHTSGATGFTNSWYGCPTAIFTPSSTTTTPSSTTTTAASSPCPATQVLGEDNPQLENFRHFRDCKLAQSTLGRKAIQIYYNNADSINAALERSPALKAAAHSVLEVIAPMVGREKK